MLCCLFYASQRKYGAINVVSGWQLNFNTRYTNHLCDLLQTLSQLNAIYCSVGFERRAT